MLEAINVSRIFKQKHQSVKALDNISLRIEKGEFVGIVGPSGSGKSTLLLIMGGMNKPDAGEILVDKTSLYNLTHNERARLRAARIGFVFQSFNLIPYLNVYDNINLAMELANGKTKNSHREEILEIIASMKLTERIDHLPNELSVGQQQRVAIARALVKNPDIIFADEPTGNLDPKTSEQIMDIFLSLHKQGKTVILITHNPDVASQAERIISIVDGKVAV